MASQKTNLKRIFEKSRFTQTCKSFRNSAQFWELLNTALVWKVKTRLRDPASWLPLATGASSRNLVFPFCWDTDIWRIEVRSRSYERKRPTTKGLRRVRLHSCGSIHVGQSSLLLCIKHASRILGHSFKPCNNVVSPWWNRLDFVLFDPWRTGLALPWTTYTVGLFKNSTLVL